MENCVKQSKEKTKQKEKQSNTLQVSLDFLSRGNIVGARVIIGESRVSGS